MGHSKMEPLSSHPHEIVKVILYSRGLHGTNIRKVSTCKPILRLDQTRGTRSVTPRKVYRTLRTIIYTTLEFNCSKPFVWQMGKGEVEGDQMSQNKNLG